MCQCDHTGLQGIAGVLVEDACTQYAFVFEVSICDCFAHGVAVLLLLTIFAGVQGFLAQYILATDVEGLGLVRVVSTQV